MVQYRIDSEKSEKELRARLEIDNSDGALNVIFECDGVDWWVASFTKSGTIELYDDIPDNLGLLVDEKGYIKVVRV